jgi:glucosamine kinase
MIEYLIAVDGGGTGTRVLVVEPDGRQIGRSQAGPSALGQGIERAWTEIRKGVVAAFEQGGIVMPAWGRCAFAAGLSGVHNESHRAAFLLQLPDFGHVMLATDGHTMLAGAHAGRPGVMVAAGTGSVGEAIRLDGSHCVVGGWGFPSGDEGSGAWLGLQAVHIAQAAIDGRSSVGTLARRVFGVCGDTRQKLATWMAQAEQFSYAQLAPLVFDCEWDDPLAMALLTQATHELEALVDAMDPIGCLPLAVCGSVGLRLQHRMASGYRERLVDAAMGPEEGALLLLGQKMKEPA